MSGDYVFWSMDKVPEMRKACVDQVISANYSDENATGSVEAIQSAIVTVTSSAQYFCQPVDCSGHGSCINGTCVCDNGGFSIEQKLVNVWQPLTVCKAVFQFMPNILFTVHNATEFSYISCYRTVN